MFLALWALWSLLQLHSSAVDLWKQLQTICKQMGMAVFQEGLIYEKMLGVFRFNLWVVVCPSLV